MSWRFMTSPKWVVRHVLVVALVAVMVAAGFWQLRRLDEKRTQSDLLEARQDRPVADVLELVPEPGAAGEAVDGVRYRSVTATGAYVDDATVVVPNRSFNGASGGWVLTPLLLTDGTAVAVIRGFIGFDRDARIVPPPPPTGEVTVGGLVVPSEDGGRLIEVDRSGGQVDELTRADVVAFDELVEAELLPVVVQRLRSEPEEPPAASGAPQLAALDRPTADDGPHLGYAMQWFTFSVIAGGGYVLLLRRVALDRAKEQLDVPSPDDDLDRELEELLRSQG